MNRTSSIFQTSARTETTPRSAISRRCRMPALLLALLGVGMLAGTAMAVLITPTDVGGTMGTSTADRKEIYAINNAGLGGPQDLENGYDTHSRVSTGVQWLTKTLTTGTMTYDLGAVYNLTHMVLWNYSEDTGGNNDDRGIKDFTIEYYDKTNGLITTSGALTAAQAIPNPDGTTRIKAEVIDIPDVSNVNKIKLVISANYGDTGCSGIGELKFLGTYVEAHVNYTELTLVQPTDAVTTMTEISLRGVVYSRNGAGITPATPPLLSTSTHVAANNYNVFEFKDDDMGGTKGTVTYTLPEVLQVSGLALWNDNNPDSKGTKNFEIRFLNASDEEIGTVGSLVARRGNEYVYSLTTAAGNGILHGPLAQKAGTVAEVFSFTPVSGVKKIQLYITTNYGNTTAGGISEVGFVGEVALPSGTLILLR